MKQLLYNLLLSCCLFLSGCSEDKGNYDYTKLNEVIITQISSLAFPPGANIQITPELSRSLQEGEEDLSFQWEVDGKIISTERNLDALLPAMSYGQKLCALIVTDRNTGMKYISKFEINIVNKFNYGYYFLTRQQDNTTIISYLPSYKEEDEKPKFLHTSVCGDVTFGKNPIKILSSFSKLASVGNYFWTLSIITGEGDNLVVKTDNATFLPNSLITGNSFIDKEAGYIFKPEDGIIDTQKRGLFCSVGKLISYDSGVLYRPARHKENYYWSHINYFFVYNPMYWAYDELSHKFYVVYPLTSNPELGIVGDNSAMDAVEPIENSPSLENETIVAMSPPSSEEANSMTVYTTYDGGINIYKFERDNNNNKTKLINSTTLPLAGVNKNTKAISMQQDCFLSVGSKIYMTPAKLPKLSEFVTIPAKYGKIVQLGLSSNETRLIITTYDENSTNSLKGSVIFVNTLTKEITEEFPNCIEECVWITGANADIYGMTGGLGDDK